MIDSREQLRRRQADRGSAYVFVLAICLIITVLAMGAMTVTRISAKTTTEGNDWEAAGTLAFSATEQAMAQLNALAAAAPLTWRSAYTSGQTAFSANVGRGSIRWVLKDEYDGNLGDDPLEPFRLYGIGQVGSVTRVYSVQVLPAGRALDVLRTGVHTGAALTFSGGGSTQAVNGPFSSNLSASLNGTIYGNIEAPSTSGSASGPPTIVTTAAKTMPSPSIYNFLLASATSINYSAVNGDLANCLLSPASNPYGTTNANGIYSITVPSGSDLTIEKCRIVGTLLISGVRNLYVKGPVEWEPASSRYPSLVVSSPGAAVTFQGSATWLSESVVNVNFNPASTPYAGASDTDLSDDYSPQYQGVFHIITSGSGSVSLNNNAYFNGTVITDAPITLNNQTTFIQNPAYSSNPPYGYGSGDILIEVPGTWRWDALP